MGLSDLPVAKATDHAKAFERRGWVRQPKRGKGSHIILTKPGFVPVISLPAHGDVKRALLMQAIKLAEMSVSEYLSAFRGR